MDPLYAYQSVNVESQAADPHSLLMWMRRVIAVRRQGSASVDWSPAPDYVIRTGDGIVVLATRAGLSGILRREATSGI